MATIQKGASKAAVVRDIMNKIDAEKGRGHQSKMKIAALRAQLKVARTKR